MDIFIDKLKITKQMYKKIKVYIDSIPKLSCVEFKDNITLIDLNFSKVESYITYNTDTIFNIWGLISENLYLINTILLNIEHIYTKHEKKFITGITNICIDKINDTYNNVESTYKKYQKEVVEIDNTALNKCIDFIKKELKWETHNTIDNIEKITDLVKKYPHAISLYIYITQIVLNDCLSIGSDICDFILNKVENVKNNILLIDKKNKNGAKITFQSNPSLKTFGLTPVGDADKLKIITQQIFNESVNNISQLANLAKKKKKCIVVINHIIKNPIEFNIRKLVDKNIAQAYIQKTEFGVTQKIIDKFNTISFKKIGVGKKWNFDVNYYGSIDSDEFIVLVRMSNDLFRLYSIYNEMPIFGGGKLETKIRRGKIEPFIEYIKNKGVMKIHTRVSEYHKIHERKIINNMFLPVKFDIQCIKTNSQIIDSKFLMRELSSHLLDRVDKIITKDFKNGEKITTFKDIGSIIHSNKLVDVLNSILIEQYDIYAIKNKDNTNNFPFSETLQTFLSVLSHMNTDFRRLMHDYYTIAKIDCKIFSEKGLNKKIQLKEIFKDIIRETLLKIISDKRNIYQELLYKNNILRLSLI